MKKSNGETPLASVVTTESQLTLFLPTGQIISYNRCPLPVPFIEWQSKSRIQLFQNLVNAGPALVQSHPAHLPVLATLGSGEFPINLASRGIGLLPKNELLDKYTHLLSSAKTEALGRKWEETLKDRVNAMSQFYRNVNDVDPFLLGGLEIFEAKTAENARSNPFVSLLYTGEPPEYPSYQFNCIVEIIAPIDLRFQFLLAARELFAFDAFHITQHRYPFGYAFHLVEILEKTPYSRR